MSGRQISLTIEFRIIRLIFLEHVVNGSKQHSGNGNNRFLVASAFFESEIAVADFWKLFCANCIEGALNKQGLDVGTGAADSGSFLLPGALVILRRKPCPGTKMLLGGEH